MPDKEQQVVNTHAAPIHRLVLSILEGLGQAGEPLKRLVWPLAARYDASPLHP
jgi:hypothetical protein